MMDFKDWIWHVLPLTSARVLPFLRNDQQQTKHQESEDSNFGNYIAIGYAHNFVEVWEWKTATLVHTVKSEPCILYSVALYDDHNRSGRILAASGTVFNKILIWDIFGDGSPSYILEGHEGVIFGVQWAPDGSTLCSVSDDRSIRLWQFPNHSEKLLPSNTEIITSKSTMFGHSERVWASSYLSDNFLVSVSEDSTCRIWDHRSGKCLAALRGHQGRNAWRVAVDSSESIIATGGGDSAVRLWSAIAAMEHNAGGIKCTFQLPNSCSSAPGPSQELIAKPGDFVRKLKLVGRQSLIIATDRGFVYIGSLDWNEACNGYKDIHWHFLHKGEQGSIWECVTSSADGKYILLGDNKGYATLISVEKIFEPMKWKVHEGKVGHVYWPQDIDQIFESAGHRHLSFFTSGLFIDSTLKWWHIDLHTLQISNAEPTEIEENKMRVEQYRAFTFPKGQSICCLDVSVPLGIILCGDTKGSVHAVSLTLSDNGAGKILHSLQSAHDTEKVTDVLIRSRYELYSTSAGRKGCMNRYSFLDGKLCITSVTKMRKTLEGIERILVPKRGFKPQRLIEQTDGHANRQIVTNSFDEDEEREVEEDVFLFGLHGTDMVMNHVKTRSQSLQIYCGRSKRAWDIAYETTPDGPFTLVYNSMDKRLHIHSSSEEAKSTNILINGSCSHLGVTYHPRETNALVLLPSYLSEARGKQSVMSESFFVTCSLDTTCRLWKLDWEGARNKQALSCQQVLRENSSNVMDITYSNDKTSGTLLLFSGGGHCSLQCWKVISVERGEVIHLTSHRQGDSESRVMAVATTLIAPGIHLVVAGNSDGSMDALVFEECNQTFWQIASLKGHPTAILSLQHVPATHKGEYIFSSGGTDGNVLLWDLSPVAESYKRNSVERHQKAVIVHPFHSFVCHQSGVNCLSVRLSKFEGWDYCLATGGDDQALHAFLFSVDSIPALLDEERDAVNPSATATDSSLLTNRLFVSKVCDVNKPLAHSAAVKGLHIEGTYILSSGPDQRLNVWRMECSNNNIRPASHSGRQDDEQRQRRRQAAAVALDLVGSCFLSIGDISGLDVARVCEPSDSSMLSQLLVCITGVGMQAVVIHLPNID